MRTDRRILLLCLGLLACDSAFVPNAPTTAIGSRLVTGDTAAPLAGVGYFAGCMAILIDTRLAVTAAHCVENRRPQDARLLLGSNINQPRNSLAVLQIEPHPNYVAVTRAFDVALLRLGVDAGVPPLPVIDALPSLTDLQVQPLQLAGFGASGSGSRSADGQRQALAVDAASVEAQRVAVQTPGGRCFGDNAAALVYTDPGGTLLLAGLSANTTTADCSGQTLVARLDTLVDFLGVIPRTPAHSSPVAGSPDSLAGSACEKVTAAGQCNGDAVLYCKDGKLEQQSCSVGAAHCVWSYAEQRFGCGVAPDSAAQAACGGSSYSGRCDSNVSVWCRDGNQLVRDDCSSVGKLCGYNAALGYFDCLAPGTAPG